jgi:ABC-type uncharacterized transport system permease subunit
VAAPALALRRYRRTAGMAATATLGESRLFLIDYLLRFLRVVVLLAIWRVILPARGAVSGMTLGAVLTYTLIAEVFGQQLTCQTELPTDLWEGTITTRLVQPMSVVEHYAADMCGRWWVWICLFSVPLLLV